MDLFNSWIRPPESVAALLPQEEEDNGTVVAMGSSCQEMFADWLAQREWPVLRKLNQYLCPYSSRWRF